MNKSFQAVTVAAVHAVAVIGAAVITTEEVCF
jgi:hypothetical protein